MILDRLEGRKPKDSGSQQLLGYALPAVLLLPLLALWFISTPPDAKARLAVLDAKAERIQKAAAGPGDLKSFPAGSVCTGQDIDAVQSRIALALADTGLQVATVDLLDTETANAAGLHGWQLSFKGTGSYEGALAAFDVLNRNRPKLFVDSVALRNNVSEVELEIEGRVFCR
jgi:hypothetical protein